MTSRVFRNLIGLHCTLQRQCIALYQAFFPHRRRGSARLTSRGDRQEVARRRVTRDPIAKFAAREERTSKAGVDDRVSSVYYATV